MDRALRAMMTTQHIWIIEYMFFRISGKGKSWGNRILALHYAKTALLQEAEA